MKEWKKGPTSEVAYAKQKGTDYDRDNDDGGKGLRRLYNSDFGNEITIDSEIMNNLVRNTMV